MTLVRTFSLVALFVAAALAPARGGIVLPSASFTDLGKLSTSSSGVFHTDEDGGPTLDIGGVHYQGNVFTYGNGLKVAVFQFDSITISGGNLTGTGSLPVALLSHGDATLGGTVNFGAGGPGGGLGSIGIGGGPGGGGPGFTGSGGGFGGAGGAGGGDVINPPGGNPYGDLNRALQGGSAGGGGAFGSIGGMGGGGFQVAALGALTISGDLNASATPYSYGFEGAGSGGGLLLYGSTITLTGTLSANGGSENFAGGGGGGGRILIDSGSGGFVGDPSRISALGGQGGTRGGDGSIVFQSHAAAAVPEPASLALLATGLLGMIVHAGRRKSRATPGRG